MCHSLADFTRGLLFLFDELKSYCELEERALRAVGINSKNPKGFLVSRCDFD